MTHGILGIYAHDWLGLLKWEIGFPGGGAVLLDLDLSQPCLGHRPFGVGHGWFL